MRAVTVDLLPVDVDVGEFGFFDRAKCTFERPSYELYARGGESEVLSTYYRRCCQASVLFQILRRHETDLEIVLNQNTSDVLLVFLLVLVAVILFAFYLYSKW
jgi:hypothetical protein